MGYAGFHKFRFSVFKELIMEDVTVVFEQGGKKAIIKISIDKSDDTLSVKCEFEPKISGNSQEMYVNLASMFLNNLIQD